MSSRPEFFGLSNLFEIARFREKNKQTIHLELASNRKPWALVLADFAGFHSCRSVVLSPEMRHGNYIPSLGLSVAALLIAFPIPAAAQYVTVTGSHVLDISGALLTDGSICFEPTNSQDRPIAVSLYPSWPVFGTPISGPLCAPVVDGTITGLQVPDPFATFPSSYVYRVTIWNASTGDSIAYQGVKVAGPNFSWDTYSVPYVAPVAPEPAVTPVLTRLLVKGTSIRHSVSDLPEPVTSPPAAAPVQSAPISSALPGATAVVLPTLSSSASSGSINATSFPGADIGAKINAAYAALPANGGTIYVPVPVQGYAFSTPIVFNTPGKPVLLQCSSNSGMASPTYLQFTQTSGIAVTYNIATSASSLSVPRGYGMEHCYFQGNGGSSIGLYLGGSNGAEGWEDHGSTIAGFGTDVELGNNTFMVRFQGTFIGADGPVMEKLVEIPGNLYNAGEQIVFDSVTFHRGGAGAVNLSGGTGFQVSMENVSFDDAQLVAASAYVSCTSCHFENPGGPISYPFMVSSGNTSLINPEISDDYPGKSTASSAISVVGGILTVIGLQGSFTNGAYKSVFDLGGGASLNEIGPLHLFNNAPLVAGTTAGRYFAQNDPLCGTSGTSGICPDYASNQPISTSSSFLAGNADAGRPYGAYLEMVPSSAAIGAAQPQFRGLSTPDLAGYYTGKIQVLQDTTFNDGCVGSYSSRIVFFTENKSEANSADTSQPQGSVDCTGKWHLPSVSTPMLNATHGNFTGTLTAATYVETLTTPASSSAACSAGQFTDDGSYHYVCTSTNHWRRVALTDF